MCGGNAVGFGFVVTSTSKKDDCASETLKKEHSPHPGYWRAGLGAISWRGREDKNAKRSQTCINHKRYVNGSVQEILIGVGSVFSHAHIVFLRLHA